eukprot:g54120.t1
MILMQMKPLPPRQRLHQRNPPAAGSLIARGRAFLPTRHWKDTQESWVRTMHLDDVEHDPKWDAMFNSNADPAGVKTEMVKIKHQKLDPHDAWDASGRLPLHNRRGKDVTAPNAACLASFKKRDEILEEIEEVEQQMRSEFEVLFQKIQEAHDTRAELAEEFKQNIGLPEGTTWQSLDSQSHGTVRVPTGVGRSFTEKLFQRRHPNRMSSSDTGRALDEYNPVEPQQAGAWREVYDLAISIPGPRAGRGHSLDSDDEEESEPVRGRGGKREADSEPVRPRSTGRKKLRIAHNPAVNATLDRVFASYDLNFL